MMLFMGMTGAESGKMEQSETGISCSEADECEAETGSTCGRISAVVGLANLRENSRIIERNQISPVIRAISDADCRQF